MASLSNLTISVIIPVHNGGNKFRRCLLSVKALRTPPTEVIVIADGTSDGSCKLAEEFEVRLLKRSVPGGPAVARNLGAHNAKGDILFFIDADVTVQVDAIEQVLNFFKTDPYLDALIGSYDDKPFETNFLSQYKNLLHHYVHQTSDEEASTFWGACGAIKRDVFMEIGGFDETYQRPSIEDIDLGYKLRKAGYKIRLVKHLKVTHLKHWGILSLLKSDFFDRALPWTDLILNERRLINDLNLRVSSRISVIAVSLLSLTILGSMFDPRLLIPTVFLMMLLIRLNWDLYRFFRAKRGLVFALKTIPWHWFYFWYSGLAFAFGHLKHHIKRSRIKK
jgi:GT2 family glycosyltransferase